MKFIGRMIKNELLSLSTLFLFIIPALNHVMVAHGAPDLSSFSVSSLAGGDIGSAISGFASHAGSASLTLAQAGTGSSALYIDHGPIFLN